MIFIAAISGVWEWTDFMPFYGIKWRVRQHALSIILLGEFDRELVSIVMVSLRPCNPRNINETSSTNFPPPFREGISMDSLMQSDHHSNDPYKQSADPGNGTLSQNNTHSPFPAELTLNGGNRSYAGGIEQAENQKGSGGQR